MIEFKEIPASKKSLAQRNLSFGVGLNDSQYLTEFKSNGKRVSCPFYAKWQNMLKRCYSKSYQKRQPTYKGCSVCEEWLTFSNFKAWMIKQDWKGKVLDKDLLVKGNKVYSPDYCVFVSNKINNLILDSNSRRGNYAKGVCFRFGKFQSWCGLDGKSKHLGSFNTEKEASEAYRSFKAKLIYSIAIDQKEPLKSALIRISDLITTNKKEPKK